MERWDDQSLWDFAKGRGISRRRFLWLTASGGAAAILAACGITETSQAPGNVPAKSAGGAWFKDPSPLIAHDDGKSLEARLENTRGLVTANSNFFVRNNSTSLDLDAAAWRLSVEGDAVANPLELTYDDILRLPSRVLMCYLECAGNHRAMFDLVQGRAASGTQWMTGGISNGEWVGCSLRDVLTRAGIRDNAVSVLLVGLDTESPENGFRRALPVEKAMHPDTLLAYGLNGEPLPRDHGFPVRALVPGWVGSSSIKWLGRIVVSSQQQWTRNNTDSYVLIGDDYPPEGEASGQPVGTQNIKSVLAVPWPAVLPAGLHRLHGFAHSPHGPIVQVEWSNDGGASWRDAELPGPQPQYSWARFSFTWDAEPGDHLLMTRATDGAGNNQPDSVPFNEKGYLFNQPLPHPIRVTAEDAGA
ncbi:MAG: molybdopterin-dependent oxidoreductase [Chloroflexota bacterium]|nr:molybdopterin-dependent oxidoreductase [Chloroflexota bacterium]